MSSVERVQTARLLLTRLRPEDIDDLHAMHTNSEVMATLGGVRSRQETHQVAQALLAHWDEHGFGYWLARELATGRFAGRGGLRRVLLADRPEVEVGYGFMPEFWGRGLATELARESIRVGFQELGLSDLVCFTLPGNVASQRVMEKAGFRSAGDTVWANRPHVLYRLRASEWRTG